MGVNTKGRKMESKKHEVPALPYEYEALEPYIDEETMRVHHDKHHQAYADKFNAALEQRPELFERPVSELLANLDAVPEDIRKMVINHGGGYYNHNLFWEIMSPTGGGEPTGELAEAIKRDFGSFEEFKKKFTETALTHFGSGWAWLVKGTDGKLKVYSLPNQDTPVSIGDKPVLLVDVWEHAYYLKYQNRRAEFVEQFWNVINWDQAGKNYQKA
ncbi:MAG: Superoxide dismutase (Mn) [bacterium ADurb.Bin400]|nr:MAG: Superoxide dismutase (Mn) [bacterium ADurb.Bin400]